MTITIHIEHRLAIINADDFKVTITVHNNDSILYEYASNTMAFTRRFDVLSELLLDNDLSVIDKWLARGMLGIPVECIKK